MEVLVLDGKDYIKASKAARDLGYTTDYIGQLCRSGQVDAHLIGRTWYVNADKLSVHKVEKKRASRVKAKESARKSIEEHRIKVNNTRNNYNNVAIRYETDEEKLIPELKKLSIQSESVAEFTPREVDEKMQGNIIENKGKTVIMSGGITVVDVTDIPDDPDTIVLKPGRIKKSEPNTHLAKRSLSISEEIDTDITHTFQNNKEITEPETNDFITKLVRKEVIDATVMLQEKYEIDAHDTEVVSDEIDILEQSSIIPYIAILLLILSMTLLSLPLKNTLIFNRDGNPQVSESFHFSLNETIQIYKAKYKHLVYTRLLNK